MSKNVFISYRRADRDKVAQLAKDLSELDFNVWFDRRLAGGQSWWEEILENIRLCDYFVVTLSPNMVYSEACKSEREYARQLGKTILPILIADTQLNYFEPELGNLQAVDYRQRNDASLLTLSKAVYNLHPSLPLPSELPAKPPVPGSYLNEVKDLINKPELQFGEQYQALGELKKAIHAVDDPNSAVLPLLQRLRERPDLSMQVAQELDALSHSLGFAPGFKQQGSTVQQRSSRQNRRVGGNQKKSATPLMLFLLIGGGLMIAICLCCIVFYIASLNAGPTCDIYGNCY